MKQKKSSTGLRKINLTFRYAIIFGVLSLFTSGVTLLFSNNFLTFIVIFPLLGILSWFAGKKLSNPIIDVMSNSQDFLDGIDSQIIKINSKSPEIIRINENIKLLAEQVNAKTKDLENNIILHKKELEEIKKNYHQQIEQYKAIGDVARAIVSLEDPVDILPRIAQLINEYFGYYHVGIFLLDNSQKIAYLRATNSDGGKRMLARGHNLEVGKVGIVGFVTQQGEARIASDTGEDSVFFDNPDLPDTRSEMALPLILGDRVIGALDIQSTATNAFTQEDAALLHTLADQIALVIRNSDLYEEARKSLKDLEVINRKYIDSAWRNLPKEYELFGYSYNSLGSFPIKNQIEPGKKDSNYLNGNELSIPIQLRGVTIGSLKIKNNNNLKFTDDQVGLARAVADRVAIALENARLLDETSRVAQRERSVGEITTKIRSANEPQEMIQTALDELKRILQIDNIKISSINSNKIIDETKDMNSKNKSDPGHRTQ